MEHERHMLKHHREMVNTRRLYKFEEEFFSQRKYSPLTKQLPISIIKTIGKMVWDSESPYVRKVIPEIRFGPGVYHTQSRGKNLYYSWCDGKVIELAPYQCDLLTLLHEMVHALGYSYHDSKFVEKYVDLLKRYGGVNKKELIIGMQEYKVALPNKYKRLYVHDTTSKGRV